MSVNRVLQVGISSFPGGVENAIMNYYRSINKLNIQFDFICIEDELAYSDEISKLGGKIYYIPNPKRNLKKFIYSFKQILNTNNYQIVHFNLLSAANIIPLVIAKRMKLKKRIVHAHNSSIPRGKLRKILHYINKPLLRYLATDFIACSHIAANWLFGMKQNNVIILNNAINLEKFSYKEESRKEIRNDLKISNETFVIGHIGRFAEEKNHNFLIDTFSEFLKFNNNSKLILVGDGPEKEKIVCKINQLNLENKVYIIGEKHDVSKYYSAMDLFCMPSIFEGLGIVLIEAQATNLFCVCSDAITDEAILTDRVKKISLKKSSKFWAKEMANICSLNYKREGIKKEIVDKGYDVNLECINLEKFYLKGI